MQHQDQIVDTETMVELTDEALDLVSAGTGWGIDPNG